MQVFLYLLTLLYFFNIQLRDEIGLHGALDPR
jgi:hypothetical protein